MKKLIMICSVMALTAGAFGKGTPMRGAPVNPEDGVRLVDLNNSIDPLVNSTNGWGQIDMSYNLDSLFPARDVWRSKNDQFKVLIIGDSYARTYNSAPNSLTHQMMEDRGLAGLGGISAMNKNNFTISGAVTTHNLPNNTGATDFPWAYFKIPASASDYVTFAAFDGKGLYGDTVGVYYTKTPAGGNFSLQAREVGGSWTTLAIIDGYSSATNGVYASYGFGKGYLETRVVGSSGTNILISTEIKDSLSVGLVVNNISCGGWNSTGLSDAYPQSIYTGIFSGCDPDLVLFVDEGDRTATAQGYMVGSALEAAINALGVPVAVIGVYPHQTSDQKYSAGIQREMCVSNGWTFIDTYLSAVSVSSLLDRGYLAGSDIHLTSEGGDYFGEYIYQKIFGSSGQVSGKKEVTRTFFSDSFMDESGFPASLQHAYTFAGNDADMYRWWGALVQSNETYKTVTVPVSEFDFVDQPSEISIRMLVLTKEPTTLSSSYYIKMFRNESDPTTEALTLYNYGSDVAIFGAGYQLSWLPWKTRSVEGNTFRDWIGYLNIGVGSTAASQELMILAAQIRSR